MNRLWSRAVASLWIMVLALSGCVDSSVSAHSASVDKPDIALAGPLALDVDTSVLARDSKACADWSYDANRLITDFRKLREVDSTDWGRRCYTYACSYTGEGTYDGTIYQVRANAGGWVTLSPLDKPSGSRYFVAEEKLPSFIEACNCCEDQ